MLPTSILFLAPLLPAVFAVPLPLLGLGGGAPLASGLGGGDGAGSGGLLGGALGGSPVGGSPIGGSPLDFPISSPIGGPLGGSPLTGITAPLTSVTAPLTGLTAPLTGLVSSTTGLDLSAYLGITLDLSTTTELTCGFVSGLFQEQSYDLGCTCLDGQGGLLLEVDVEAVVNVDGLGAWVDAQIQVAGFAASYPAGSWPTCDGNGGWTCPFGTKRKADGTCSSFLAAHPHHHPIPSGSASPAPTGSFSPTSSFTSSPTSATASTTSSPVQVYDVPSSSMTASSVQSKGYTGPVSTSMMSSTASSTPVQVYAVPTTTVTPTSTNTQTSKSMPTSTTGPDEPIDVDSVSVSESWTAMRTGSYSAWTQVVTDYETMVVATSTVPSTVFVQVITSTQTAYVTQTATATATVTSYATTTNYATTTKYATSTNYATTTTTETSFGCGPSASDEAISVESIGVPTIPAPTSTMSTTSTPTSTGQVTVAAYTPSTTANTITTMSSTMASSTAIPTPSFTSAATTTTSAGDDDNTFGPGPVLAGHPHTHTPAPAPTQATCGAGQQWKTTMCCRVDQVEDSGVCGCATGFDDILNVCVQTCLGHLVGGTCDTLDLSLGLNQLGGPKGLAL